MFVGLVLWALNYQVTTYSSNTNSTNSIHSKEMAKETKTEKQAFDVSKVNLPSIFDALIRSL